jgi:hypothetical protein
MHKITENHKQKCRDVLPIWMSLQILGKIKSPNELWIVINAEHTVIALKELY